MSFGSWNEWVTKQRQAYSARLKLAHLTRGSESSSWPTAAVMDVMGGPYKTEFVNGSFRSYHNHSKEDAPKYGARLRDAVTTPVNWPTPTAGECLDQGTNWETLARLDKGGRILRRMESFKMSGLADPANTNSVGNHQEWLKIPKLGGGKLDDAAHSNDKRRQSEMGEGGANTRGQNQMDTITRKHRGADGSHWGSQECQTEPPLGGNPDGSTDWVGDAELYLSCDNRTDELRLLGNGVVPATAEIAFRTLWEELTK